ncbi:MULTISPECIES: restriction endonuclease subunit S [Elizabethkingia]|uniref:Type I restriction modification DNA specificity domain-containing protein n=1 Tax=Elizabethkingia meningoseptica TaxID=238 RepID=A0A1T3EZH1_ELIME|nr:MULTISPECIES: restriction endonuclease subunit S [Elizabethkingia]AQX10939.1 hypothetical protein BBD35_00465 [Elizabethkingia meningoseptica]MBG0512257.1 restriction endonuclease subunit S [Elizabethkingia meningoseptica]MDE5436033.1 restriction endonuclease subunit S [Elizabethkingia meningoseptica]MDE5480458.1 restriction endonuclease subunit S [Elizabethkingia meningoseptica]MDE5492783.1 restriction endonuclease subunit S [Elizabethkingia meningoseptica]
MMIFKRFRVRNLVDDSIYYPIGDGDHGSIKPEMYQEDGIPYIRVQNLNWNGQISLKGMVFISDDVNNANAKSILKPNDILIAKTGATIGKLGLITDEIGIANTTSSVGKVTVDSSRFSSKYILYCFQTKNFNDQLWLEASQKSAQPGFNIDDLVDFEVFAPEKLEDQISIAEYLDKKTTEIDTIIAKKEQFLESLEEKKKAVINEAVTKGLNPNTTMKDSGIDWIGKIPEHWEVSKLKYFVSIRGRLGWKGLKAEEYVESGYGFLSTPDIKNKEIDFNTIKFITEERYYESPEIMLEYNDILLVKDGSTLGIVNIIKDLPFPTTVNSSIGVLRITDNNLSPNFLFYLLKSNWIQKTIEFLKQGQGVPHLFQKDIKEFDLLVPPIKEQDSIIEYISIRTSKIELIIDKVSSQIEKLKEYRQSLISEAVTGKLNI